MSTGVHDMHKYGKRRNLLWQQQGKFCPLVCAFVIRTDHQCWLGPTWRRKVRCSYRVSCAAVRRSYRSMSSLRPLGCVAFPPTIMHLLCIRITLSWLIPRRFKLRCFSWRMYRMYTSIHFFSDSWCHRDNGDDASTYVYLFIYLLLNFEIDSSIY